jgi:hypothetical protein
VPVTTPGSWGKPVHRAAIAYSRSSIYIWKKCLLSLPHTLHDLCLYAQLVVYRRRRRRVEDDDPPSMMGR